MLSIKRIHTKTGPKKGYISPLLPLLAGICICSFLVPHTARASMYRCISRSGGVMFTNVRNSDKCTPVSLGPSTQQVSLPRKSNNHAYDSWIRTTASRYGVDDALIKAIIHIESGFNHKAVSRRGAKGLMQLMPETSRSLQVYNPFDPQENIDGGTRYFRKMMDNFNGNISLSLAAYNAGPALVKRIGGIPAIPETRNYVRNVLRMYRIYKGQ